MFKGDASVKGIVQGTPLRVPVSERAAPCGSVREEPHLSHMAPCGLQFVLGGGSYPPATITLACNCGLQDVHK